MKASTTLFIRIIIVSALPLICQADVHLPKLFSDHMVLQRDQPVRIWGWADANEKITVSLLEKTYETFADEKGNWQLLTEPASAGGPYNLIVTGKNKVVLEDILFGDVWICSGQSNMQWQLKQTNYSEIDSAFIKSGNVRLFTVHIDTDYMPRKDLKGGEWQVTDFENIQHFSAVAYHFGKYLNIELDVPIGLVSSNLGATAVETWMSNEALMNFPQFQPELSPILKAGKNFARIRSDLKKTKPDWENAYYLNGPGIQGKWYLPETDVSDWVEMDVPGFWEDAGYEDHDGAMWFRKEFDLPKGYDRDSFLVQLLQIDDYDITWVNGEKIGETFGRHNHRNYMVATDLLKPADNVIVVRVFDVGGKGGFSTNAFWAWGNSILSGKWKIKPGLRINPENFPTLPSVNVTPFSSPAVLYNANIAPLTPFSIKGAIWYQGESNAGRAYEYRELFTALIKDWRKQWGQGDFPFLFVQLANYRAESPDPGDSDWAELREAQSMALQLPTTGMAVTIDIGEADDIHPKNKEEVGKRLGLAARKVAYGQEIVFSGPVYQSATFEDGKAVVRFRHTGSGLVTNNKFGYVHGFELAGEDRIFHWAKARITGDHTVEVTADQVKSPTALRYAWSNNPGTTDLYNKEGLPAVPFRTDDWKEMTRDALFDHQKTRF